MYFSDIKVYLGDDYLVDMYNGEIFDINSREDFLKNLNGEITDNEIFNFINERKKFFNNNYKITSREYDYISSVRICVSNSCNLRCTYCYASGGSYHNKDEIMTIKTAKDLVQFIKNNFKKVEEIFFFGGEPLLNIEVIEYFCKHFSEKRLILITNGTILNDNIIKIISRYDIKLAVSVDGSEKIHDFNRKFLNQKGTYKIVEKNISALNQRNIEINSIVATYTRASKNSITEEDLVKYIVKKFKPNVFTINYDATDFDIALKENIQHNIEILKKDKTIVSGILNNILYLLLGEGKNINKCGVFNRSVLIYTNGEIYPCQTFIGEKNFVPLNIYNFESEKFIEEKNFFNKVFLDKEDCSKCISEYICTQCPKTISKARCEEIKNKTNQILSKINDIFYDTELLNAWIEVKSKVYDL